MKILMFGWEFPPSISGGLGTACHGLTEGLLEKGTEITFVVPRIVEQQSISTLRLINGTSPFPEKDGAGFNKGAQGLVERPVGVLLSPYMTESSYRTDLLSGEDRDREERLEFNTEYKYGSDMYEEVCRYAANARAIAASEKFDVIAAHDWMAVPAGLAARETAGAPLVVHVHSLESDRSAMRVNEVIYGIERFGMLEADHVIAVSLYTKNKIIEQYGIPEHKISVVHNAVLPFKATEELKEKRPGVSEISGPRKNVLFLGRVTRQKGPEYFFEAALKVLAEDREVRFTVAGSGDMVETLKKGAAGAGVAENFEFTGFLNRQDVAKAYAMSDVYVMPSVSEPFGITALEAIEQGVPVILSRQSGAAEVLRRCPVVDFRDTHTMARRILEILGDRALGDKIIREGREDMRELTWRRQAEKVLGCYRSFPDMNN